MQRKKISKNIEFDLLNKEELSSIQGGLAVNNNTAPQGSTTSSVTQKFRPGDVIGNFCTTNAFVTVKMCLTLEWYCPLLFRIEDNEVKCPLIFRSRWVLDS